MNRNKLVLLWIFFMVLGRLIPHPANITPMAALCLFASSQLSLKKSLGLIMLALLISDSILGYLFHYPIFGSWSIFTYSGFAAILLLGRCLRPDKIVQIVPYMFISTLGFWLWTNFGVWCLSQLYPHNAAGLALCYHAALPFLRNALIGDAIWALVIFVGFDKVRELVLAPN